GAFHRSWVWEAVLHRLAPRRWNIQTVDLPSVVAKGAPRSGMYDDAKVVRELLCQTNNPQIVIAHSYGGIPVTQVAHELPQVRHIIYIAAFQLDVGESLLGAVGGRIPSWWIVDDDSVTVDSPIEVFYNDVQPCTAAWAQSRLLPSTFAAFTEPVTAAAWRYIPSTYVICERDQAGPPRLQEVMSQRANRVERISTGHSPMLSQPGTLAEIINRVAAL
ncbi:alpha/beta hydrolase, partial [Mycobacterium intracellulare]